MEAGAGLGRASGEAFSGDSVIAFTIGREQSYDAALLTPPVIKLGQTSNPDEPVYPGGWVWRTEEDARAFVADWPGFAVYELRLAGAWAECVSESPGPDGVHNLTRDAEIIRKISGLTDGTK